MLNIGLVGLPNAGKSTLFNALTQQNVLVADYPFATIKPNTGIIALSDPRLDELQKIFQAPKLVPPSVTFVDIAGLVAGASQGEGLGNQFLSHIRETTVIAQVVGAFQDQKDVVANLEVIKTELLLADYEVVQRQIDKASKLARSDKGILPLLNCLNHAQADIDQEILLHQSEQSQVYQEKLQFLNLLTLKPMVYVFNTSETDLKQPDLMTHFKALIPTSSPLICLSAKLEAELSQLEPSSRNLFLNEYGLKVSGLDQLARAGFKLLKLQTFLTAGKKEVRAWIIPQDCLAPQAAGAIHSDMEKGFIAAEVISYEDLKQHQSWLAAKSAGRWRTEGRGYKMQINDVVEFRFNL